MIPRSVQIQATVGGEFEGDDRIPDGRPLLTAVSQMPSSGNETPLQMDFPRRGRSSRKARRVLHPI
jgi:hypothetical protein